MKTPDTFSFENAQSYGLLSHSNIIIQHHDGDQQLYKDQCGHKALQLYLLCDSSFFSYCLSQTWHFRQTLILPCMWSNPPAALYDVQVHILFKQEMGPYTSLVSWHLWASVWGEGIINHFTKSKSPNSINTTKKYDEHVSVAARKAHQEVYFIFSSDRWSGITMGGL